MTTKKESNLIRSLPYAGVWYNVLPRTANIEIQGIDVELSSKGKLYFRIDNVGRSYSVDVKLSESIEQFSVKIFYIKKLKQ